MDENTRSDVHPILAEFYLQADTTFKGCSLVSDRLNKLKYNEIKLNEIFKPLSDTVRTDLSVTLKTKDTLFPAGLTKVTIFLLNRFPGLNIYQLH